MHKHAGGPYWRDKGGGAAVTCDGRLFHRRAESADAIGNHRRRSSVNFRGGGARVHIFAPKICMKN